LEGVELVRASLLKHGRYRRRLKHLNDR
jgi:hypothetical protein